MDDKNVSSFIFIQYKVIFYQMKDFYRNILLTEGARDRALEQFIPLFQKRGINANISWVKQTLMSKFVNEANIHNLSLGGNYYLVGIARYYFNGDLTTNKRLGILYNNVRDNFKTDICQRLDALINILRNAYIDSVGTKFEQPEDFGTLSLQRLLRKYNAKINKELGIDVKSNEPQQQEEKPKISDDYTAGKNYTYEVITSFEQCRKYNGATTPGAWCITYGKQHYDGYIRMFKRYGGIHYVIFRQNGYEKIPRRIGKGYTKQKPHDAYGNSLICVLQRNDCAEPTYITSRWNHGSSVDGTQGTEADHAYTKEEFLNVIGCDESVLQRAYEQWKALGGRKGMSDEEKKERAEQRAQFREEKNSVLRALKYMQMLINGGANPFTVADQIQGVRVKWKTFGWDFQEWQKKTGIDNVDKNNAPQKYAYTVAISLEDGDNWFYTIMDRKVLLFDQILETELYLRGEGETFFGFGGDGWASLYDRKRHSVLNIDGITKFKYSSPDYGIMNGWSYNTAKIDAKYIILAVAGNQLALVNLQTMKPIKARNGSAWFESITNPDDRSSNYNYSGRVSLPHYIDNVLLKMVYDSASGEKYIYNTATDSFVNLYEGVPSGWYFYSAVSRGKNHPQGRYLTYVKGQEAANNRWAYDDTCEKIYKNADNGSIFAINGISVFTNIWFTGDIVAYMVSGSDDVYFYDMSINKLLELNGQLVTTKHKADVLDKMGGYIRISLSRYKQGERGYMYGNSYAKVLLYNPYTKDFYHDNISGYFFRIYGNNYNGIKVYIPEGKEDSVPDRLKINSNMYIIPKAEIAAQNQQTNESRMIRRIIREEIIKLL